MAREIIDIGESPNDGQGDPLRLAMQKCNNNFSEIYSAGPVSSNITIANNTITNSSVNGDVQIKGSGSGQLIMASTTIPDQDNIRDLGSQSNQWSNFYAVNGEFNTLSLTGTLTASSISSSANITSNNLISVGNITAGDTVITTKLSVSATSSFSGNLSAANVSANGNISVSGNISGSNLLFSGNINGTDLFLTGNISSDNVLVTGQISAASANVDGELTSSGINTGNITAGNITVSGTTTSVGNVLISGQSKLIFNDGANQTIQSVAYPGDRSSLQLIGNINAGNAIGRISVVSQGSLLVANGAAIGSSLTVGANLSVNSAVVANTFAARCTTIVDATGSVDHDWQLGATFIHTGNVGSFVCNMTNMTLSVNEVATVKLVILQDATPGIANAFTISNVAPTVFLWAGNAVPTPTAFSVDMMEFEIIRNSVAANGYVVLGKNTNYGA